MKKTEVYMNKLPETCNECPYHSKRLLFAENEDYIYKTDCRLGFTQNCNLQSLKTHDRELVKEVCEKIRSELEKELKYDFTSYVPIMNVCNKINRVLDQTQKEYEK